MADMLADRGFQQGYLYSGLYTVLMVGCGYEALIRWRGIAIRKAYQTWRFASLISFQAIFFLLVNVVAVQALSTKYAWRAWGLYQPYPLFFNTFFWWYEGDPAWIIYTFVGAGILGSLIAIPIAARNHGKRCHRRYLLLTSRSGKLSPRQSSMFLPGRHAATFQ